jgi:hypothetical protein
VAASDKVGSITCSRLCQSLLALPCLSYQTLTFIPSFVPHIIRWLRLFCVHLQCGLSFCLTLLCLCYQTLTCIPSLPYITLPFQVAAAVVRSFAVWRVAVATAADALTPAVHTGPPTAVVGNMRHLLTFMFLCVRVCVRVLSNLTITNLFMRLRSL